MTIHRHLDLLANRWQSLPRAITGVIQLAIAALRANLPAGLADRENPRVRRHLGITHDRLRGDIGDFDDLLGQRLFQLTQQIGDLSGLQNQEVAPLLLLLALPIDELDHLRLKPAQAHPACHGIAVVGQLTAVLRTGLEGRLEVIFGERSLAQLRVQIGDRPAVEIGDVPNECQVGAFVRDQQLTLLSTESVSDRGRKVFGSGKMFLVLEWSVLYHVLFLLGKTYSHPLQTMSSGGRYFKR